MAKSREAIKVRCIETGEVYNSYSEAGKATGVSHVSVRAVVIGEKESVKGLHFEAVEENEQEVEGLQLTVTNEQGETIPVIDSREVARMMGKEHWEILRYIEGEESTGVISIAECLAKHGALLSEYFIESSYFSNKNRKGKDSIIGILPTLQEEHLIPTDYFIESSYTTTTNRKERCYLCTRMGCDLLATRQKGEKGILFSAKYVKRFKEMEEELKSKSVHQYPEITEKQQCILAIYDGGASAVTASKRLVEIEVQEATAPLKGTIAEQQAELTQAKTELTDKTEFIDDINDCFPISQIVKDNKQLLKDRKDIVICPAILNRTASELNMPVNKIDNPIEHSPYRRVNAYPRKVWEKAYPDIKLPEKESKKLPEKESK